MVLQGREMTTTCLFIFFVPQMMDTMAIEEMSWAQCHRARGELIDHLYSCHRRKGWKYTLDAGLFPKIEREALWQSE